ncbi:MAG: TRAP transporter small permease subunit [Nitratireductor sp.]|nr:TRAP transporter small permease subunit [Nitratireductor sp.]
MRFLSAVSRGLAAAGGWLIAALIVLQLMIVVLRYVFSAGWPWSLDLTVFLFLLIATLPGLLVVTGNSGVRVDLFYAGWLRGRRRLVDRLALLLLLCPSMACAAWASLGATLQSWQVLEGSASAGGLPGVFLLKTVLTLFFAVLALAGLLLALRRAPYADSEQDAARPDDVRPGEAHPGEAHPGEAHPGEVRHGP